MEYRNESALSRLNLHPRTDEELRDVVAGFEQKWQDKARRYRSGRRVAYAR